MDRARQQQAQKIARQVVEFPAEQRQQATRELCAGDAELRMMVLKILSAADKSKSASVTPSEKPAQKPAQKPAEKPAERPTESKRPRAGNEPKVAGFEILGRLGKGGMGVVWEALQLSTRRRVALKLLSETSLGSAKQRARFVREVELAASLEHPNIARIYDSGLNQGIYHYAMELVRGVPLDQYVTEHNLQSDQILRLIREICLAMEYAHGSGVVHRDLKPTNILVDSKGQPHILDFGLAKSLNTDDTDSTEATATEASPTESSNELALTMDGDITGTPMYMSPEQAAGNISQIDARSDVYSLGVIAYRLLTGVHPHDLTGTYKDVIRRIVKEDVRLPRTTGANINSELEAILLKALSHNPADRYISAGEFAEDIDNYTENRPLLAHKATPLYLLTKKLSRNRRAAILSLASCIAVAAIWIGLLPNGWLRELLVLTKIIHETQTSVVKEVVQASPTTIPIIASDATASDAARKNALEKRTAALAAQDAARQAGAESDAADAWQQLQTLLSSAQTEFDAAGFQKAADLWTQAADTANNAKDLAAAVENQAFTKLNKARDNINGSQYLLAHLDLTELQQPALAHTKTATEAAAQIQGMQSQVGANLDTSAIKDFGDYLFYPKNTGPGWDSARTYGPNIAIAMPHRFPEIRSDLVKSAVGYAYLRVFLEDSNRFEDVEVTARAPFGDTFNITPMNLVQASPVEAAPYVSPGGTTTALVHNGDIFRVQCTALGLKSPDIQAKTIADGVTISDPSTNRQDTLPKFLIWYRDPFIPAGTLTVSGLRQVTVPIAIKFDPDNPIFYGDIALRRMPPSQSGNLELRVKAEDGVSLQGDRLLIGGAFPISDVFFSNESADLTLSSLSARDFWIGLHIPFGKFQSIGIPQRHISVTPQSTTTVDVTVYAPRKISFDWWYRKTRPLSSWQHGSAECLTGERWTPPGSNGLHAHFLDWSDKGCSLDNDFGSRLFSIHDFSGPDSVQFPTLSIYNQLSYATLFPLAMGQAIGINGAGEQAILQMRSAEKVVTPSTTPTSVAATQPTNGDLAKQNSKDAGPETKERATPEDAKAFDLLSRAQRHVGDGAFLAGYFDLQALRDPTLERTQTLRDAKQQIQALQTQVDANVTKDSIKDFGGYAICTNTNSDAWNKTLQDLNASLDAHSGRATFPSHVLVRVYMEDDALDDQIDATANGLSIRSPRDWGFGGSMALQSGQLADLIVPRHGSADGTLTLSCLHHASAQLKVHVEQDKITALGDILLRKLPPSQCGTLVVKVKGESGVDLTGATLRIGRSYLSYALGSVSASNITQLNNLASGSFQIGLVGPSCDSAAKRILIKPLSTTTVEMTAFAPRNIKFEWWHRTSDSAQWEHGTGACESGRDWGPPWWPNLNQGHGSVLDLITFQPWAESGCVVEDMNCYSFPISDFNRPDAVRFPKTGHTTPTRSHDVQIGQALGIYDIFGGHQAEQAIIRIVDATRVDQKPTSTTAPSQ